MLSPRGERLERQTARFESSMMRCTNALSLTFVVYFFAAVQAFGDKTPSKPIKGGTLMVGRSLLASFLALALVPVLGYGADRERGLDIYFVDTEGGAATLIVT